MSRVDLETIREWATIKLSSSEEPLGAESAYLRLRETVDAILAGTDSAMPQSDGLLRYVPPRKAPLRLVWSTDWRDASEARSA